jgi:hypothetical protein
MNDQAPAADDSEQQGQPSMSPTTNQTSHETFHNDTNLHASSIDSDHESDRVTRVREQDALYPPVALGVAIGTPVPPLPQSPPTSPPSSSFSPVIPTPENNPITNKPTTSSPIGSTINATINTTTNEQDERNLTQLEQDILAKSKSRSGHGAVAGSLAQLEQDVMSKASSTAVSVSSSTMTQQQQEQVSQLERMEQDLLARKRQPPMPYLSMQQPTTTPISPTTNAPSSPLPVFQSPPPLLEEESVPTGSGVYSSIYGSSIAATTPSSSSMPSSIRTAMVTREPPPPIHSNNDMHRSLEPGMDTFRSVNNTLDVGIVECPPPAAAHPADEETASGQAPYHDAPVTMGAGVPLPRVSSSSSSSSSENLSLEPNDSVHGSPPQPMREIHHDVHPPAESAAIPYSPDLEDVPMGIQAELATYDVVDAIGVAVIASDEEVEHMERQRRKRIYGGGCALLLLILLAVILPVSLTVSKNNSVKVVNAPPTQAPSRAPSSMPSMAPTSDALQSTAYCLRTQSIVSPDSLASRSTPQYQALTWITKDDTFTIARNVDCQDEGFRQRYAMAVWYFAVDGETWGICNRNNTSCTASSWLSSDASECTWYKVQCDDNVHVSSVNFGTYRLWMVVLFSRYI